MMKEQIQPQQFHRTLRKQAINNITTNKLQEKDIISTQVEVFTAYNGNKYYVLKKEQNYQAKKIKGSMQLSRIQNKQQQQPSKISNVYQTRLHKIAKIENTSQRRVNKISKLNVNVNQNKIRRHSQTSFNKPKISNGCQPKKVLFYNTCQPKKVQFYNIRQDNQLKISNGSELKAPIISQIPSMFLPRLNQKQTNLAQLPKQIKFANINSQKIPQKQIAMADSYQIQQSLMPKQTPKPSSIFQLKFPLQIQNNISTKKAQISNNFWQSICPYPQIKNMNQLNINEQQKQHPKTPNFFQFKLPSENVFYFQPTKVQQHGFDLQVQAEQKNKVEFEQKDDIGFEIQKMCEQNPVPIQFSVMRSQQREKHVQYSTRQTIKKKYNKIHNIMRPAQSRICYKEEESQHKLEVVQEEQKQKKEQPLQNSKPKPKKSLFKNSNRHLIITLKHLITDQLLKKHCLQKSQIEIAKKLINKVRKLRLFSKKSLFLLFGTSNPQIDIQLQINNFLKGKLYPKQQIAASHQLLKRVVLSELKSEEKIQYYSSQRKIIYFRQYRIYLKQFLIELANNNIKRRFTRLNKIQHNLI